MTDELLRGSGTSQATAVVSGAAALLLSYRPELTPDQIKALLRNTAAPIPNWSEAYQGRGLINIVAAAKTPTPDNAEQTWERSTGLGSLEASRGTQHGQPRWRHPRGRDDGVRYEVGPQRLGRSLDARRILDRRILDRRILDRRKLDRRKLDGASWTGASWTGASWTGASWTGASWTGASWNRRILDRRILDRRILDRRILDRRILTGASWTGASWTGRRVELTVVSARSPGSPHPSIVSRC